MVIAIPGEVLRERRILVRLIDDIAMLVGLGVRAVLVTGAAPQIDAALRMRGVDPQFVGGYRVTDEVAMEAAMEAAGWGRTLVEALLSKGPSMQVVRRHERTGGEMHFAAAAHVVSGNFLAARRRGIIDGTDFRYTGQVRFVDSAAIRKQLDAGSIVLLSNLGYSVGGELLNCNTWDVAVHAAVELNADKLICMHLAEVATLRLPEWLSVGAAEALFEAMVTACEAGVGKGSSANSLGGEEARAAHLLAQVRLLRGALLDTSAHSSEANTDAPPEPLHASAKAAVSAWRRAGFPPAVAAAYDACRRGIKRAHLVDARLDGGILLELYRRDGVGTMISADFYEGIRRAGPRDCGAVKALLAPLERAGIVVERPEAALASEIGSFVLVEREGAALACAQLAELGAAADGTFRRLGEVAAFCVHPEFRGTGRGDALLDWLEQDARSRGLDGLVLLTTRTADWFQARDFRAAGAAFRSRVLPAARRERVDPARNSQLYVKRLEAPLPGVKPGSRIGF